MPNYYTLQEAFCRAYDRPILVPFEGWCYRCNRNIWDKITATEAAGSYITACPYCHRGFSE